MEYKTSDDDLKGGIPAERSQVRNRKPYWYSLQGEQSKNSRIVFPEHLDRRYVFTLLPDGDESVVIDTLYLFDPLDEEQVSFTHAGLNSIFAWYQIELRGRSQHGEGVLKVKIPDYQGVLMASPERVAAEQKREVLAAFSKVPAPGSRSSLDELGSVERHNFDVAYARACGFANPEEIVLLLEQELRALAGERLERKLSVADAKISRRKVTNVAASIDAYAARVASRMPAYPDPRIFIDETDDVELVTITGPIEGSIEIGMELFDLGDVTAGGKRVAHAGTINAAQIVKAALLIDPEITGIKIPKGSRLVRVMKEWNGAIQRWQKEFDTSLDKVIFGVTDSRTRDSVRHRALKLLHAI